MASVERDRGTRLATQDPLRFGCGAGPAMKGGSEMHFLKRVVGIVGAVIGFAVRRRRLLVAVVVALLLVMPLVLTGDGELFVLNALGIGITALVIRRIARLVRGG